MAFLFSFSMCISVSIHITFLIAKLKVHNQTRHWFYLPSAIDQIGKGYNTTIEQYTNNNKKNERTSAHTFGKTMVCESWDRNGKYDERTEWNAKDTIDKEKGEKKKQSFSRIEMRAKQK